MNPIFGTRDYLDEIFFWLSSRDLAATICVNKAWFRASVFPLWKTINLSVALKLLGPIVQLTEDVFYSFSEMSSSKNWERFMVYAQHVRVLHADDTDSFALATAIVYTPSSLANEFKYFFPNCRYLSWHTSTTQIPADICEVLLPPSLDHVVLTGRAINREWLAGLCQLLVARLSTLSVFHIDCESFLVPLESPSFISLLTTFSSTLTYICIPEILFTDITLLKLLECDLHHMTALRPSWTPMGLTREYADRNGGKFFLSLKSLTLGPLTSSFLVLNIFDRSFPSLTKFCWDTYDINFDFDTFVMAISTAAPNLEILSLGVWGFMNDLDVSWSSFRWLLNRVKLTSLSIHCVRVDMTLDNLIQLLRSRQEPSSWHVLEITSTQPFHFQDALLSVAKYSPKIHTLCLRVHDQNFVRLYTDIPELSSRLIPRHAKKNNIRTQVELRGRLKQAGFFLPCISIIRLNQSICSLDSIGPVAFLILALCDLDQLQDFIADDEDLGFRIGCRITKYHNATRKFGHIPGPRRRFFRH